MLGKNRMASGREEAFKARAVSFGSSQEGSFFCRQCFSDLGSDSLSALPTSVWQFGWHRMVPFVGLGQSAHLPYYGVL